MALAAGNRFVAAAGSLQVTGGAVLLPAALVLPDVAGATLTLEPGAVSVPATGRTPGGLAVTGAVADGAYAYRLQAPPQRADVEVTAVAVKPLGNTELTLAAPVAAATFDGGTLTLGSATWTVLAARDRTVTVVTAAAAPVPSAGRLTGPPTPELRGSWLPNDDRTSAQDPGPTTSLVLWARSPYAWFRGSDDETVDGFDAHNPDYACGPTPVEDPICAGFDDLPAGPLAGTFRTELLTGVADGDVRATAPGLQIGWQPGFGVVELSFAPPVDVVFVHCHTGEGGLVSILRDGVTVASAWIPSAPDGVRLVGPLDTVRIEGQRVSVERVCFTPGWTCVPFEKASFPQGSSGEQSYAGLTVASPSAMTVVGNELRVDPVTFVWNLGGPLPPISATLSVIIIRLPEPVTRIRLRVLTDCAVWLTGNDEEVATLPGTAGQTVTATARIGVIDRIVVLSTDPLAITGPCHDGGPFGWRRQEQWTWRRSMRAAAENLHHVDPVLAPGDYTLSVLTGVEIGGASPGSAWDQQVDTTFTVGAPPGLPVPTGDPAQDRHYPGGGVLADLTAYVRSTVPVEGERPAYRTYDVGVAFTAPYVSRMFLAEGAELTVAVVDPNGVDRRSGAPNRWGDGPQIRLGEQETRFIKTLHGDGTQICALVDLATIVRDEGLAAGAGELLAPATQHVAELRAAGHARAVYRFAFTTSRFADFRHHVAYASGALRRHAADGSGTVDLAVLTADLDRAGDVVRTAVASLGTARAAATTGTPTRAQQRPPGHNSTPTRRRNRRSWMPASGWQAYGRRGPMCGGSGLSPDRPRNCRRASRSPTCPTRCCWRARNRCDGSVSRRRSPRPHTLASCGCLPSRRSVRPTSERSGGVGSR